MDRGVEREYQRQEKFRPDGKGVPKTLKEVKEDYRELEVETMLPLAEGYRHMPVSSRYGDMKQRWLIIHSEQAYEREIKTFEKNLEKERDRNAKNLKHLRNESYACSADAEKAAQQFRKRLKHQTFEYTIYSRNRYNGKGRPSKGARPETVQWYIDGALPDDDTAIEETKKRKGMFVVATNELDTSVLSDRKLLMVMTLSLLIYSIAEMRVRNALKENEQHIWNQKNKPTDTPTVRWVFMIFEDVLLLYTKKGQGIERQPMNIREEHRRVLECLGTAYEKMYFL